MNEYLIDKRVESKGINTQLHYVTVAVKYTETELVRSVAA